MNKPELSIIDVSKKGNIVVSSGFITRKIDGVFCNDRETNFSCCGIDAMEKSWRSMKHKKARVSDRIIDNILEEIKFTY